MPENISTPSVHYAALSLNKITVPVHLGVSDEERETPQNITVSIEIGMDEPLRACETDAISDTFCYDTMLQLVEKTCQAKPYHLIEHLCYMVYISVKKVAHNKDIRITVHKQYAPLSHKLESASFVFGDTIIG
jgi:dihydroneopterin aldolase